ncbi:bet1-like protein SNARE 1-2-like protein [Trifolium pratense]|uniref:Bet1-like protein SNARE 1-2-like protein n=1 Tax=Trifolium pratense TaxID=57577 RepID=A0A2K3P6J1_TRIPR|nr:bet1-like protein SNARE 1-2-like protein [Trifolium pratense]
MLDRVGNKMDGSRGMMLGTMDRFKKVFEKKSTRKTCSLVGYFTLAFIFLYYLIRSMGLDMCQNQTGSLCSLLPVCLSPYFSSDGDLEGTPENMNDKLLGKESVGNIVAMLHMTLFPKDLKRLSMVAKAFAIVFWGGAQTPMTKLVGAESERAVLGGGRCVFVERGGADSPQYFSLDERRPNPLINHGVQLT